MKPSIQSRNNATIKQVIKLRDASTRRQLQQFIIDGEQEIARAITAGVDIECVYFPDDSAVNSRHIEQRLLDAGLPTSSLQPVSATVMRKLAYGDRESSIVAVAHSPALDLSRLRFNYPVTNPALILVLDSIEKPGNLGACIRTAAATGAQAIVLTNPVCDVFNPNAIRASRGTMFCLPIAVATPAAVIQLCEDQQIQIQTARVDGEIALWDADFVASTALVFGSEAHGLDASWPVPPCKSFFIPMNHSTDSLNVSISAALTLYETVRQRQIRG